MCHIDECACEACLLIDCRSFQLVEEFSAGAACGPSSLYLSTQRLLHSVLAGAAGESASVYTILRLIHPLLSSLICRADALQACLRAAVKAAAPTLSQRQCCALLTLCSDMKVDFSSISSLLTVCNYHACNSI